LIGAVEPVKGKHFGFCYTVLDTEVMNEFLRLLSRRVGSQKHVVLVVDNAGWHTAEDLRVPWNITLLPLPPYSPELNPIENLWGYLKENFLSARIYADLEEVIQVGCDVFKNLSREVVRSVCHRDWVADLYAY
jgi:transposase